MLAMYLLGFGIVWATVALVSATVAATGTLIRTGTAPLSESFSQTRCGSWNPDPRRGDQWSDSSPLPGDWLQIHNQGDLPSRGKRTRTCPARSWSRSTTSSAYESSSAPVPARRAGLFPLRQHPLGPHEVARVAVGVPLEVVLVLRLGLPERPRRRHVSHHLPRPPA
jgi:hypothetical protein